MNVTAATTPADITAQLENMTAVELRKLGGAMGIKGASKGKKAELVASITELLLASLENLRAEAAKMAAEREAEVKAIEIESTPNEAPAAPAEGKCIACGMRNGMTAKQAREQGMGGSYRDICLPCYEEAGWENTHSDAGHADFDLANLTEEQATEVHGCWICYPELNEAKKAPRAGRSRAGMVIIAKGTEIHKSATFKAAAEAAGWTVTVQSETYEPGEDAEGEGTRYYATATRGDDSISLAWDGRAYDYPASSAHMAGKVRKIRNLKEALRVL